MNAEKFAIDPARIGVFGMTAGGHLSLMLGTASDEGDPNSKDPVRKVSDRVQAIVAYVAPTDLRVAAQDAPNRLPAYANFPALRIDQKTAAVDSPLLHVTADDPPTLLLAGAKDELVPIFHSRNIQAAFKKAGVESQLIEFENAGHGFAGEDAHRATLGMVGWFVKHLTEQKPEVSE
jgi:acetyl esterase/lipase